MIYLFLFLLGMLACWLICRRKISDLEFDKEILLDFNEKLMRDRDELEERYLLTSRGYIAHLDSHYCVVIEVEEEWQELFL